jgi:hypothetical protein
MTIDNGSPPPDFLRLEAVQNGVMEIVPYGKSPGDIEGLPTLDDLKEMAEALDDPLKVVARRIRALTLEHITTMCSAMGKPDMRDTLVKWAVAYLDGTPMPEDKERRL